MIACDFGGFHATPFFEKSTSSCFDCQFWFGSLEGMKPPPYKQQGSLFMWVGAFCIIKTHYFILLSDKGVSYPFHSPHFILALPTMTQFCDWLHSYWGPPSISFNRYRCCSLCLTYMFLPKFAVKSHYLRSSPFLSGCCSRCPW